MTEHMRAQLEAMSLPATATIRQTMQTINRGGLGTAFLIDPETRRFVGLVTDGDIRRALLQGYGLESPVMTVPRPQPVTARVGMSPEEISSLLSAPVRVVPLLDGEGRVVDLVAFDRRMRLPVAEPLLGEKELLNVSECVLTGWVSSGGKFVTEFEEAFAEFCDTRFAVACSSGTTALHLALLALGVGDGDEVIVPTLTFIATANAVTYTRARPVFVDSEAETWNIDPDLIAEAITPRTKAIIPVHLYGHPANMDPLLAIAAKYGLAVIEDAAEAHGARYKGRRVGGIGDIGVFSFYGNKIVTTGEGGMLVTNRADVAEKARRLRDHGMSSEHRYWHTILGYNYRMTNIQAALGVAQMEKIEAILDAKRRVAEVYRTGLTGIPGIQLPPQCEWAENVYWMFSVLVNEAEFGMSRDMLMHYLSRTGMETRPFFPPVHTQPIYNTGQALPVAERLAQTGINLPSSVTMHASAVERVCASIRAAHLGSQRSEKGG